jgi:hypothetical protein
MADLGTVTVSEETYGSVRKVKFSWLSDGDGKATKTTTETYNGKILGLTTVPDGTDAPDDNYNVRVYDEDTADVLMGGGLLRDTANTEYVLSTSLGAVANDKLSLSVTDAGAANKGTVYLYIR